MNRDVIYELFYEKVRQAPGALAVFDEDRGLSRAELDKLIDTIAAKIPVSARRVGIIMTHSVEMIATVLAALKIGKAYVPAEPFFPKERIRFMMSDAEADVVITNSAHISKACGLPTIIVDPGMKAEDAAVRPSARPDDPAYILYTSGSTGTPKGVAVRNRNVCHYVRAFQNEFKTNESDIMLQYSVCSFDIFVEEVFTSLLSGAALAIPSAGTKKDIRALMKFVKQNNVTQISGFPYLLLEMNHLQQIPKSLRLLISGGDVLRGSYVDNLLDKVEVYNTYGPSETTVCASYCRVNGIKPLPDGSYPIGKPVLGAGIEIMDDDLNTVERGETGEICISGGGVSAGYVGGREKENETFVTRADGSVLYRSGDMGYFLPDGNIAFLHRKDSQIMILGKRVEIGEVENVLCQCPEIEKAVVRPYTDEQNLHYMTAYIVLKQPKAHLSTLKKEMARFLPNYMIPEFFVRMTDLPLNANGKIDTDALPIIMKEGYVC